MSVPYALAMANEWPLPKVGVTYVRTTHNRVNEAGGLFALTVACDRHVTGFTDAGVTFARSETSDAVFRPNVGLAPGPGSMANEAMRSLATLARR